MFDTSRDPFDRLNLIEYNLAIMAQASEEQAHQLAEQAKMLEQVTKHMRDLSVAIMDLYSRDNDAKQRLTNLEL
jgi:uncharacterized coiled-coil protein SlyX